MGSSKPQFPCHLLRGPCEAGWHVERPLHSRGWHWKNHSIPPRPKADQTFHFLGMASLETVQNLSATKNKHPSLHSHLAGQEQSEHGGARFPPPPGRSPHCWAPLGKVASTQPHPQSRCLPSHLPRHRGLIVPSLLCAGRPPQSPLETRQCPGATTKDVHEACVQGSVQT